MNKTPSILVDTGFEVDQNGGLTEIIMPNVVATLNAPTKITFNGTTLNYIPSTTAALQELSVPNATTFGGYSFSGWSALKTIRLDNCETLTVKENSQSTSFMINCSAFENLIAPKLKYIVATGTSSGVSGFKNTPMLTVLNLPELIEITDSKNNSNSGLFYGNAALVTLNLPKLTTITNTYSGSNAYGSFYNCTGIATLNLPSIKNIITNGTYATPFGKCTGLLTVALGSEGNPVSSLSSNTFSGCTQSGLTITVYTQGGASLSGEPWGATNATIEYEEA